MIQLFYHTLIISFIFFLLESAVTVRGGLIAPAGEYNNFTSDVFNGTILNFLVNFRFRHERGPVEFPEGSWEERMYRHEPIIFQYFDWVIWNFIDGHLQGDINTQPRSILFRPKSVHLTSSIFSKLLPLQKNEKRVLVLAGGDQALSEVLKTMEESLVVGWKIHHNNDSTAPVWENIDDYLQSRFSSIFFEAKDIEHKFIQTIPMGFTNFYVLQVPRGVVENCIQNARNSPVHERKLAFAAWGKEWPNLDRKLWDRIKLSAFLDLNTTTWVTRESLDFGDYWKALGKYKYSLCPRGNGIQSPKLFEAMVLRVVPVVTRVPAFEDLEALGFPILIIDHWYQLNPEFLEKEYEKKFMHVNWERVLRMITIDGVWSLLMNGKHYPF